MRQPSTSKPEDTFQNPYEWRHLCQHLAQANRLSDIAVLALNFSWLSGKLRATKIKDLLDDLELVSELGEIQPIIEALQTCATIVGRDPNELAGQLTGRINARH